MAATTKRTTQLMSLDLNPISFVFPKPRLSSEPEEHLLGLEAPIILTAAWTAAKTLHVESVLMPGIIVFFQPALLSGLWVLIHCNLGRVWCILHTEGAGVGLYPLHYAHGEALPPPPPGVVNQNAKTIQNAITPDWALPIGQLTTTPIALFCTHHCLQITASHIGEASTPPPPSPTPSVHPEFSPQSFEHLLYEHTPHDKKMKTSSVIGTQSFGGERCSRIGITTRGDATNLIRL